MNTSDIKTNIHLILQEYCRQKKTPLQTEFKFLTNRKFRFDWAIPKHKIAIEYEGIGGGKKTRHLSFVGYSNDCEKYNLAACDGWRVLRFTVNDAKDIHNILTNYLNKLIQ